MTKVYCITWSGSGHIAINGCYFNHKQAVEHLQRYNDSLKWWLRLTGNHWYLQILEVQ